MKLLTIAAFALATAHAQLPETPQPTVNKAFVFTSLTEKAAMATDFALSVHRISNSHNPCVVEINPIYGRHPSPVDYAKIMIPLSLGLDITAYELKKHHSRIWALPHVVSTASHFVGIISNSHNREKWQCNLR